MRRIVTIWTLSTALALAGVALAAPDKAELLTPELIAEAPAAVALFHPNNARSVQLLDQLAVRSSGDVLAVCVGAGCTADVTLRTAQQREWPFRLAYDPTGDVSLEQLGMRAAGSIAALDAEPGPGAMEQGLTAAAGLPVTHALTSPLSRARTGGSTAAAGALAPSPRAMNHALTARPSLKAPSVRDALFISVPLVLVGFGGAALVFGARRRRRDDDEDRTEAEQIDEYIRTKHGRKPAPRLDV